MKNKDKSPAFTYYPYDQHSAQQSRNGQEMAKKWPRNGQEMAK
jgi:hypothetical protein